MRLVFLAVDDEFAGAMQRYVYERHPEWVVGSVISKNSIYKKNKFQAGLFVLKKSGFVFLAELFRMKILRKIFGGEEKITPVDLAQQYDVNIYYSGNINDKVDLDRVRQWNPDLVISTNFSHYIGKNAREVAGTGTWNLHKSYLPHYRGMAPSFYALLEGAEHVGATLHVVTKGFDTGDLLDQVKVPIGQEDSVYSLNRRTSDEGGRMMADFLDACDLQTVQAKPQPEGDWPENTYPTRNHVRQFRAKKLRF